MHLHLLHFLHAHFHYVHHLVGAASALLMQMLMGVIVESCFSLCQRHKKMMIIKARLLAQGKSLGMICLGLDSYIFPQIN